MRLWQHLALVFVIAVALQSNTPARAQVPTYRIERIASGLQQPVFMAQAPGDPANIIYYMTRVTTGGVSAGNGTHGSLWRYDMDTQASTEVMNLSHRNLNLDLGPQGFAFHPDFNNMGTPGYQKIYLSSATTGGPVNYVEEYAASELDGTVPVNGMGEPIVNRLLLQYTNVTGQNNHVIDWIGFDPTATGDARNYLYVSTGDGSNGASAPNRPEQKANSEQGKLLRIDVDPNKADAYPGDPLKNFAIPATNPIPLWNATHGGTQQLDGTTRTYTTGSQSYTPAYEEIYFTGTRNQFRMSIDRATGDIYMGDVGENSREEVNFMRANPYDGSQLPYDFGFPQREGTGSFISQSTGDTTIQWDFSGGGNMTQDSVNPIREGDHENLGNGGSNSGTEEIRTTSRSAYIGGYVYRGPVAELQGKYFYSDFVHGNIFSLDFDRDTPIADFSGTNFNQQDVDGTGFLVAALGTREVVLNRNLNSLWHTIMVDPNDPTYTPALGAAFGIGRVVSFGEDNAGNLYIVDMGGTRGDPGFSNDYPGGTTGQIFRVTPLLPPLDMTLTVDRDTGEMVLSNSDGTNIDFKGYSLFSAKGAIDPNQVISITGNYDSSPGDGSIDNNDPWQITANSNDEFAEETTGDAGTLAVGAMKPLGDPGAWIQSIYEDFQLLVTLPDDSTATASVVFTGNGGQPFDRSDLNFNGGLDPGDWDLYRAQHGQSFPGMSMAESYGQGDLNGDGVNDFVDFRLFQADYIAANGAAAFAALSNVPEPATLVLLAMVVGVLPFVRFRNRRGASQGNWRPFFFLRAAGQSAAKIAASLAVVAALAALPSRCEAQIVHRYSFNEPATGDATGTTIIDSVGGANGTVLGAGSSATGTELVLPGGSSATQAYVDLPNGIVSSLTDATFEAWYTINTATAWSRIFDFGSTTGGELNAPGGGGEGLDYIFYAPSRGTDINAQRLGMRNNDPAFGGAEAGTVAGAEDLIDPEFGHSLNVEYHVAVVYDADGGAAPGNASMALYINGAIPPGDNGNPEDTSIQLGNLDDVNNWLGRSNWTGDQNFGGSLNEFRIYDVALTAEQVEASFEAGLVPADFLELNVNTFTGDVSISNENMNALSFDYYRVASAAGALDPGGWNSLDAQNIDAIGPDPGESWDEAGGPDSNQVSELYLLGASMLDPAESRQLGNLFDPSVIGMGQDGDLVFQYALQGSNNLATGTVNYIVPPPLPGDYNGDGSVNAADYTVYRNHLGEVYQLMNEVDGVTPGMVTVDDYNAWKARYGNTLGVGSGAAVGQSAAVPEPTSALLLVVTGLAQLSLGWHTRSGRRVASRPAGVGLAV